MSKPDLYWGIRIKRGKLLRELHVFADSIRIDQGVLMLMNKDTVYRAFAPGEWLDVYSASCWDGTEMFEEHDVNLATGEDARN